MISVLVVDPDRIFLEEVSAVLDPEEEIQAVSCVDSIEGLDAVVEERKPSVVLLGPGWGGETSVASASALETKYPEVGVLLAVAEVTPHLFRDAVEAKVKDVLVLPTHYERLVTSVRRCHALAQGGGEAGVFTDAGALTEGSQASDRRGCRVITVFSTKGGVGKTTIATNLAVLLSKLGKVIIVDLDLQFGDVGVMLRLQPKRSIYDAASARTQEELEECLTRHSSGLKALLAPPEPELADLIPARSVQELIRRIEAFADYIVIDTPPSFNDAVLSVLDSSTDILLVSTMDIPSVKNVKVCLETLELLGYGRDRSRILVNRAENNLGIKTTEVEAALGKATAWIPNDKSVPMAVNKGIPVVLDAPRSTVTHSLLELSKLFAVEEEVSEPEKNKAAA